MFCSDGVVLAKFDEYVLTAGETFTADIAMRRYGSDNLCNADVTWMLLSDDGTELGCGTLSIPEENIGLTEIGTIEVKLPKSSRAQRLHLILSVTDTEICNAYDLYMYPAQNEPEMKSGSVTVTNNYSEAIAALEKGGKVLFMPNEVKDAIEGFYCTDFWCYPMFRDICQ